MVLPQTTRIYMVTQINVPYLFEATRYCMVLPQTTRIYMVTQINVPYLFEATRYCMVLPQTTRIYMVTQINVPYLCGDHNDTLYLWGHHLVSDRICRALSKYAMLLYGAHRHAPDLSGSSELNYSIYWVCADYKLQTLVAPNLWGAGDMGMGRLERGPRGASTTERRP